jgi:anti-anti-sigma factor
VDTERGTVTESVRDTHTWDGHLMLVHRDERQRRAGVVSWIRRGLELGAKILYTEPVDEPAERALVNVLKQHELDVDRALDRGQLQVVPADDESYSTSWQAGAVDAALEAGYPTVRWSAEALTAWGLMSPTEHADIEWATDELCQRRPVSILCQYPSTLTPATMQSVCAMHGSRVRESLLHTFANPGGNALAGEVDVSNEAILHSSLTAACAASGLGHRGVVVDLSRLTFLDVAGTAALLAGTSAHRANGGSVLLRAAQPLVERLLRLLGVDQEPGCIVEEPS